MKKGTKSTVLSLGGHGSEGNLGNVDYKFKMGVKPIVSFAKQLTNCLHRGRFHPQALRGFDFFQNK